MKTTIGWREWLTANDISFWRRNGVIGLRDWFCDSLCLKHITPEYLVQELPGTTLFNNDKELTVPDLHLDVVGWRQLDASVAWREPTRGTKWATGYDIYCSEETVVQYGVVTRIPTNTGLVWEWPFDLAVRIEDKSGLADKAGITCLGGRVDSDYRWDEAEAEGGNWRAFEIGVLQTCVIPGKVKVYGVGDKVAQMVITRNIWGDDTGGGNVRVGGFGSTGVR